MNQLFSRTKLSLGKLSLGKLSFLVSAIEWYQLTICVALANVLSKIFFTNAAPVLIAMFWLAAALGRLVGAYLFGVLSDKKGRVESVIISFIMMIIVTAITAILPNNSSYIFVLLALLRGIAIGGNHAITVMASEAQTNLGKYYLSSISLIGFLASLLISSCVVALLNFFMPDMVYTFGWRIALLISLPISFYALSQLRKLQDKKQSVKYPHIKTNYLKLAMAFILTLIQVYYIYIFFVFLPNYKIMVLNQDVSVVWFYNMFTLLIVALLTTQFAKLADKFGPLKNIFAGNMMFVAACALHFVVSLSTNAMILSSIIAIGAAFSNSSAYCYITVIFPKSSRGRISSVLVNLSAAICTITIPNMYQLAIYNFNYFVAAIAFISSIAAIITLCMREAYVQ